MFVRRDGSLRVPSPSPTRRHLPQSRDTQSSFSDDHFLDPRLRGRDPSPGGLGRLSTSAPSTSDTSPNVRRYRDHQRYVDTMSYVTSVSGYATSGSFARSRESSPRMTSSSHGYVNGDATPHPGPGRPRSFPEQRGAYLSEDAGYQGYGLYSARGREVSMAGEGSRGQNGHGPYAERASPNSEEAVSSVTLTAEGVSRQGLAVEAAEGSFTCDDGYTWHSALTCYLCAQLFRRPRILPCGHTFCSECLAQLKDESLREGRRGLGGPAACTWEGRHRTEMGVQFVCPIPECRYAMRLMNLSRWSTRNKAVTEAVTALRRMVLERQDASTQTDITLESLLVTIPRSLIQETPPPGGERGLVRRNSSSLVDRVVHRALSMDSLSRSYIPPQHLTWRSYVAMLGMHILQQTASHRAASANQNVTINIPHEKALSKHIVK